MNYLLHLICSGDDPDIMTGNLMGDFVKGRVGEEYPPRVRLGILLHRRIDSFAQRHPLFQRSRQRLDPAFGLWRGVLVDMFYDHVLADEWDEWSCEPFPAYLVRARRAVEGHRRHLPERMRALVPVIFEVMLPAYRTREGVERALKRMSSRVRRPNPLALGGGELRRNLHGLRQDFREFLPLLEREVHDFLNG